MAQPDTAKDAEKVFARKATGLIRGLSWKDLFVQNENGLAPTAMVAALYVVVPAFFPGADIITAYMLILPIALCYAISYGILGSCMPRSGGDYIFGSRIVHPVFGLMGSFMYFNAHFMLLGSLPIFAFRYLLPTPLLVAFPGNPAVARLRELDLRGPEPRIGSHAHSCFRCNNSNLGIKILEDLELDYVHSRKYRSNNFHWHPSLLHARAVRYRVQ